MKIVCRDDQYVAMELGEILHTEEELDDLLDKVLPSDHDAIDPPETDTDMNPEDFFNYSETAADMNLDDFFS